MSLDEIQKTSSGQLMFSAAAPQSSSPTPMIKDPMQHIQVAEAPKISLYGRIINYLDDLDKSLDNIPNNCYQEKIDKIAASIQKQISKLDGINTWLNDNGQGEWYKQLATFLYKLPICAIRNIIRMVYVLIKEILLFAVHPLKQFSKLARMLVNLAMELTKPETWAKIGAGVIGASLGQAAVGCPLSIVGIGIGAAMLISGLTVTAIKAAVKSKSNKKFDDVKEALIKVGKELPEVMLTGFLIGLMMGAIRKTVTEQEQTNVQERRVVFERTSDNRQQVATEWGRDYAAREGLPTPDSVWLNPRSNLVTLQWKYQITEQNILQTHSGWRFGYYHDGAHTYPVTNITITPDHLITPTQFSTFTNTTVYPAHIVAATTSKVVPAVGGVVPYLGATTAIKA